ncbi:hypothetical protein K443DRAFT_91469 [Laccaria amethystina LaAM-08-1]|uniref:Uncharacterized protein n=1 Tax=Laccaria amethystina LaAM-08-1 TaxID=1095629 RepID=A0A0C9YB95_9AGAR|nr:hypothetical protein K443DRAFT_91469 [Laccaria amethystina LaAM-08-1]
MIHYFKSIKSHSSADRYNTEWSEQLHINFAKDRKWLDHREAMECFKAYLNWLLQREEVDDLEGDEGDEGELGNSGCHNSDTVDNDNLPLSNTNLPATHHLPIKPGFPLVNLEDIINQFHVTDFLPALTTFIRNYFPPPQQPILPNPMDLFDIFKWLSIYLHNLLATGCINILQCICAVPLIPGPQKDSAVSFDIVLVRAEGEARNEVTKGTYLEGVTIFIFSYILLAHVLIFQGLRVVQVNMFFALPDHLRHNQSIPKLLAYIEWFNPLRAPDPDSDLNSVTCSSACGCPVTDIIPIHNMVLSCYLIPKFGTKFYPATWTHLEILDNWKHFSLNKYINL